MMAARGLTLIALFGEATQTASFQMRMGMNAQRTGRPSAAAFVAPQMVATAQQLEAPSMTAAFNGTWYSVGFASELQEDDQVFATRLWGEPIVLYRSDGEVTCVRDVCPHRSAPLSMGEMENGQLRCFYHGWGFGKKGECTTVPTVNANSAKQPNFKAFCATHLAVVEHEGMLWVWRGDGHCRVHGVGVCWVGQCAVIGAEPGGHGGF